MGCVAVKPREEIPELESLLPDFTVIGLLESNITKYWEMFLRADIHRTGKADITDILTISLEMEASKFLKRVFGIFPPNLHIPSIYKSYYQLGWVLQVKNGKLPKTVVTFRQFVLAHWNFCTLEKDLVVAYVFDVYVKTKDPNFVELSVKEIFGNDWNRNPYAKKIMSNINLLNVMKMQESMRNKALTAAQWSEATSVRATLCGGRLTTVTQTISLMDRKPMHQASAQLQDSLNYATKLSETTKTSNAEGKINGNGKKRKKAFSENGTDHASATRPASRKAQKPYASDVDPEDAPKPVGRVKTRKEPIGTVTRVSPITITTTKKHLPPITKGRMASKIYNESILTDYPRVLPPLVVSVSRA